MASSAPTERQREVAKAVIDYGVSEAARRLGIRRSAVQKTLQVLRRKGLSPRSQSTVRRYLLTAAQDDTDVHKPFWANLLAYAEHLCAEVMVGPFTYNKSVFSDHETRHGCFRAEVQPYLRYDQADLGPIVFCAEMNTLPTAVQPLSSLEAYTGQKWGVFPHAKVSLVSVPTSVDRPAKQIMTTGCVTLPNYIEKKAGLKAHFHHVIGATLVEIDDEGRVFCRQLNAESDGTFQDLDIIVRDGRITGGHVVEAIGWGDLHFEKMDPLVAQGAWGVDVETLAVDTSDTMIDTLRPRYQFFHDALDFTARNHHNIKDPYHRLKMIQRGTDRVEDDIAGLARFSRATQRDFCQTVFVFSNHDDAYPRWLKSTDPREDPINLRFWCLSTVAQVDAMQRDDRSFNVFWWALQQADPDGMAGLQFVDDDQSFIICQAAGGIECGLHGHLGINGARGNAVQFTKTAMKINKGHDHSPSIHAGVYTAGISGRLDQGYNKGLSGWSQTHIVTYPSGKRTLVTMVDGRWRA